MKFLKNLWAYALLVGLLVFVSACAPQAGSIGPTATVELPGSPAPTTETPSTETPAPTGTVEPSETPAGSGELAGTSWVLGSITLDGVETPAAANSAVDINFLTDGYVEGHGGCNSYRGEYRAGSGSLTISKVASTLKACLEDDITAQETRLLGGLTTAEGYTLSGDTLVITFPDGEITFHRAEAAPETPGALEPVRIVQMINAQAGWAVGAGDGQAYLPLLFTADGGQTWSDRTPPMAVSNVSEYGPDMPAFYFQSAQRGWISYPAVPGTAADTEPLLWSTQDGGLSWESIPLDTAGLMLENFYPTDLHFVDEQNGWMIAHLGAGMMHDYIAIFRTTDGGATWERVSDPDRNSEVQSCGKTGLVFTAAAEGWMAADCPGLMPNLSFFHTTDGGATWAPVDLPLPEGMRVDLETRMGEQCGINRLWVAQDGTARLTLRCMDYDTSETNSWLYTLSSGAETWQPVPLPVPEGWLDFTSPDEGWMLGSLLPDYDAPKSLYHTTDGGQTWTLLAENLEGNQVDFVDTQDGWIAPGSYLDAPLIRTTDGGQTWQ